MLDPDKVKAYIRDRKELNVLLNNKEQFDDDEIEMFDKDVRDEIILTIPSLITKKDTIPDLIVLKGVIAKLMQAAAQQENRNQMVIGDDNVGQIDYSNKSEKYFSIAQMYQTEMLKLAETLAASSFYNEAWGDTFLDSADYEFYMGDY